jgi:hypothetical protein
MPAPDVERGRPCPAALVKISPYNGSTITINRIPDPACVLACSVHSCPWRTCPTPIGTVLAAFIKAVS